MSGESLRTLLYVGTYTGKGSKGIYVADFDSAGGKAENVRLAAETTSPSFLAIHPSKKFLYAVGETSTFNGKKTGAISAFSIAGADGALTRLNSESSGGAGPCHLSVHPTGRMLAAANYSGGSVVSLPIGEDGRLGPAASFIQHEGSSINPARQKEPHAHSINFDSAGKFAFVADLGIDQIVCYRVDSESGKLSPAHKTNVTAGSGPRHFCFHPGGKHAFAINELSNTLTAFDYNAETGALNEIQSVSTLPGTFSGTSYTAEVVAHPQGKFLYGSNRGHNSIVLYHVDKKSGKVSVLAHQSQGIQTPRNFAIDPTGRWLLVANQDGASVSIFGVDPETGELHPTEQSIAVTSPVCLRFLVVEATKTTP